MDKTSEIKPRRRVERIVWEFNGPTALAGLLGISGAAVFGWQARNTIPSRWQPKLLDLAERHGIELKAEDLIG